MFEHGIDEEEIKQSNKVLIERRSCIVCTHMMIVPQVRCKKNMRVGTGRICEFWEVYPNIQV